LSVNKIEDDYNTLISTSNPII